jgi:hypothetical protein
MVKKTVAVSDDRLHPAISQRYRLGSAQQFLEGRLGVDLSSHNEEFSFRKRFFRGSASFQVNCDAFRCKVL